MIILGNKNLLNEKLAVVLNSSQSKTPCGDDPWVKQTEYAVSDLINEGYTLITSLGLITWELNVHSVNVNGARQVILCALPGQSDIDCVWENVIADFGLNPDNVAMQFSGIESRSRSPKDTWQARDKAAVALANKILPISIRPAGRLQALLELCRDSGKIDTRYQIEYSKPLREPAIYNFENATFPCKVWDYVTHWTKTHHGPWPAESKQTYFDRLLRSGSFPPNSAFATLRNIIGKMTIRASTQKIRDAYPAIGFTECHPLDTLKLIRWRPRMVNWNFEPYGIAINKEVAIEMGMRPVFYGTDRDYHKFSEPDKPFFQNLGKANVDWSREREWRHIGDIELNRLHPDQILLIVWREHEASILRRQSSFPVVAFNDDRKVNGTDSTLR